MDTHALIAQLDQSKIQTILKHAMFQLAMDNTISNSQLMDNHVEDANHANGQDKFQTTRDLLVSLDLSLYAETALLKDLLITTHASNAQ